MTEIENLPESVVKKARKLGGEDIVCQSQVSSTKQIRFANNEITATKTWETAFLSVFLTWKKRVVATSINDFSKIDSSLNDLMKLAKSTEENQNYHEIASGKYSYKQLYCDKKIVNLEEELIDYVDTGINSAIENGAKRVAGVLYTSYSKEYLATSNDIYGDDEGSYIEISIRAFADKEASGHGVNSSTRLNSFNPNEAGKKAGKIAKKALSPKIGEEGKIDIIFEPLAFSNLLDVIGHQTSAFYADSGLSVFKDKLNKKVASEKVSLNDNGTINEGLNSSKFDEEGVPTKETCLIKNGVLKTYLHNSSTAKKFDCETTGNAGLIAPMPWNLIFEKGDLSKDQLFGEVKNGLYITNVWYTRFQNYETGDFSTIPRDGIFLIKNGEIEGSLKNIRISDNILNILKNIKAVGNEHEQIHWWEVETPVFCPYVVVEGANVTKSTK